MPAHKLELWPGYVTSIRQHETDILMCSEINHKVMRQETALELLTACAQRDEKMYKVSFTLLLLVVAGLLTYQSSLLSRVYHAEALNLARTCWSKFEVFAVVSKVERNCLCWCFCVVAQDWIIHKPYIGVQSCQESYVDILPKYQYQNVTTVTV